MPEISQRKRDQMRSIIDLANASARERVPKIRYQRPHDSVLNKSNRIVHFNSTNSNSGKG